MGRRSVGGVGRVAAAANRFFLPLLIGAYALAAALPGPGTAVRHTEVVAVSAGGVGVTVTLPVLLLAGLLFNAGLAADVAELSGVVRRPRAVLAGLAANALVPVGLLAVLAAVLRLWPDPDEGRCLLVGLGVVAAMPIAGSSAAWSQTAGGSAALSLGLVVLTTVLSPVVTPLTLAAVGPLAGGAAVDGGGAGVPGFLIVGVVLPSAAGMATRAAIGRDRVARAYPWLKLLSAATLLVLCYANATAALPAVAAEPDWDYLALAAGASVLLCGTGFAAGWGVARAVGADAPQTRSLVFGLGMNNNGTGLVLAGAALAGNPAAAVPVLTYNLVQHLAAGVAARALAGRAGVTSPAASPGR